MKLRRNLADDAQYVLQAAADRGVVIPSSSRLDQMARLYGGRDGTRPAFIAATDPKFAIAREGVRDVLQFAFILDQVGTSEKLAKLLKMAIRDAALPQESTSHTPGRDTQCELYIAAICAKAKMEPQFEEPDIQCRYAGQPYGLAIKRLKSLKMFDERFNKAADQVKRSGTLGVIVIDLTLSINPQNLPITLPVSDAQYAYFVQDYIRRFIDAEFLRLAERVRGSGVRGLILLNHDVRQQPDGNWGLDSITMATHLSPYNAGRRREFDGFFGKFKSGLATLVM